jgi:hypothetical protein
MLETARNTLQERFRAIHELMDEEKEGVTINVGVHEQT